MSQDEKFCRACGEPSVFQTAIALPKHYRSRQWIVNQTMKKSVGTRPDSALEKQDESLLEWIISILRKSVKDLPKKIKSLAIFGAVVLTVNLLFWSFNPYLASPLLAPLAKVVSLVVFLTATYNDVVPKTIFWVMVFTFGKRLFKKVRKEGFKQTFSHMGQTLPLFLSALAQLKEKAYGLLLLGGGFGLIIANNFASYSRFSGARNKLDKYFIVLLMAFAISYILGEAKKTGVFKFVKLLNADLHRLFRKENRLTDEGVYLILSGFILGLLLDAPIAIMGIGYGGYILGGVALVGAVALQFIGSGPTAQVGK